MSTRVVGMLGLVIVAAGLVWGIVGCEKDVETGEATGFFQTPYASEVREDGRLAISTDNTWLYYDGQTTEIKARDGKPPYTWRVESASKGRIISEGISSCTYERLAEGNNTVVCRDRDGDSVSVALFQYELPTNETANVAF
jgi:hypothetical protein